MTEVRDLSSQKVAAAAIDSSCQFGLFASSKAYKKGDAILSESPLIILKHPSEPDKVRSQFDKSCFAAKKKPSNDKDEKDDNIITDLTLPASSTKDLTAHHIKKLKGLALAAASYAMHRPNLTDETKEKLFQLYHPSTNNQGDGVSDDEKSALKLVNQALKICQKIAAPDTSLNRLVQDAKGADELINLLLIYSCNAFEGGRIYHRLSRANHSCNPNAIVCGSSSGGDDDDVSVLKAACDIAVGEEITISYLGSYLYAGYPTRQRVLKDSKYFTCQCDRCSSTVHSDLASCLPCPVCHPRTGRYLDEDVMFDEGDEGDLTVSYATPKNGMIAEERSIECKGCNKITSFNPNEQSMRKKKEAACVNYMNKAEDKVYDRLEGNDSVTSNGSDGDKNLDVEKEANEQFYEMATSICGAKHWTTHFMNLSLIEESLANFQSTFMSMGQNAAEDAETMEELLTGIAEAADGIERAWVYASGLNLKTDPSQWLFDYTVGLARALVSLGDAKSQQYAAQWISKVEDYAEAFESDGMQKVVSSLKNAWKRHTSSEGEESDKKRQKVA
mmetsp:Transcript_15022/g.30631  ORF Transcript_15022/g.30631 Transcript_15022/m.30631 type:complete len:559 (-) Transcript_15022:30-1706(-)|eukprot:CAMPEP_0113396242 /NCGR_PEP_ID=MMETSP0013_2-20120614/13680_1 /TAXON_ID=2843 ORGANISM="Skeletonema costatum, Strain 1716" /NCGR_SAMPLE_ID=MMETSP0013_2 /ASSEMBLY_ACC=CAM_ASM_000158 /LENGTH=558 /DNA_ID=CAMNT_0000280621 /DNA_START=86 /DNA_END=1762 /DNA_ORIENTATION=- /assembly_acc=CAM_ASM_000158